MVEISICIATWNRKSDLANIIDLLEHQTISKEKYEIIVVDSCSPDGTGDMVRILQRQYDNIIYIENADNVLAVKRNRGIKVARGQVIVFMDDDVYPSEGFIKAHYEANMIRSNSFFCGQIRFRDYLVNKSNYYRFRDSQHLDEADIDKKISFNNIVVMNLSFRKEYIDIVGLVNEKFIGYGCEDMEFGYRVTSKGYDIRYLPNALAYHDEKSSSIIEYGKKLYKSALFGQRILEKECPEAFRILTGRYVVFKKILSLSIIKDFLGAYLLKTDRFPRLYNYLLYKAYLYACIAQGERDQKKYKSLTISEAQNGW